MPALKIAMTALCLTRTSTALFNRSVGRSLAFCAPGARRQVARMSIVSPSAKPLYDLYVKGSPEKGELGDCAGLSSCSAYAVIWDQCATL